MAAVCKTLAIATPTTKPQKGRVLGTDGRSALMFPRRLPSAGAAPHARGGTARYAGGAP